jgi:hypothetical protein
VTSYERNAMLADWPDAKELRMPLCDLRPVFGRLRRALKLRIEAFFASMSFLVKCKDLDESEYIGEASFSEIRRWPPLAWHKKAIKRLHTENCAESFGI